MNGVAVVSTWFNEVSASIAQSRFFERAADVVGLESDQIPKSRS